MSSQPAEPGPAYDYALGGLTAVAIPLIAARILVAADVISIANPIADTASALAALAMTVLAFVLGYRRTVQRARARESALRQEAIDLRAQRDAAAARAVSLEGLLTDRIQQVDVAVDVHGVRLMKIIKMLEEQRIGQEDTQPIAHLHSISGGRTS